MHSCHILEFLTAQEVTLCIYDVSLPRQVVSQVSSSSKSGNVDAALLRIILLTMDAHLVSSISTAAWKAFEAISILLLLYVGFRSRKDSDIYAQPVHYR